MDERSQDSLPDGQPLPEGSDFLRLCWQQEDACAEETDRRLPELGVKAPRCLDHLGTVLSLLDRLGSCWWGCRGGGHHEEYIIGRATSGARAALRLMRFGFYDEALAAARSVGEVANLLALFHADASALSDWKTSDAATQRRTFAPVRVRCRLEDLGAPVPIGEQQYRELSAVSAHVNAETRPQAYNDFGIPMLGQFQEEGVLVVLNELATAASFVLLFATFLLDIDRPRRLVLLHAGRDLAASIGGVTLSGARERRAILRSSSAFQELIRQVQADRRRQREPAHRHD